MRYDIRFPGFRFRALTFSYDDGVRDDIRLVNLFAQYGLKGTFNLNSGIFGEGGNSWRLSEAEVAALYEPAGMEIALHSYTHPHLDRLTTACAMREIIEDRRRLEALCRHPVDGFAYPYGTTSDPVVDILRLAGVKYARTVVSTERFDLPQDWLRLPATCHHGNPHLDALADRFLSLKEAEDPKEIWRTPLALFYVWGHSYEFSQQNNWEAIERFAAKVSGRDDIWYATNGEIYRYLQAAERLEFTCDGSACYNPNVLPVYFISDGEKYVAEPGKTLVLR